MAPIKYTSCNDQRKSVKKFNSFQKEKESEKKNMRTIEVDRQPWD